MGLKEGKLPPHTLIKYVLRYVSGKEDDLIVPAGIGLDAAAVEVNRRILVITMDPITGGEKNIGWLAVHINANDVAVMGAKPRWMVLTALLPTEFKLEMLERIMEDVRRACVELNLRLIGGHTEVTSAVEQPILVASIIGEAIGRVTPTTNCKAGDLVLMTKTAGIEGTAIIASDYSHLLRGEMTREELRRARAFIKKISVVKEAILIADLVNAMHDPTEGGLTQGLWEMGEASRRGLKILGDRVPIAEETRRICKILKINPLNLISSGVLLAAVPRDRVKEVKKRLTDNKIPFSFIGEFTDGSERRMLINGDWQPIEPVQDELWRLRERLRSGRAYNR